jgi:oligoribonuclease NrnB/cAMP/cGMP phosphodiesterase (DHH superfamily)
MKSILCFHHNDSDGRASGAIVRYALGKDVILIESDYDGKPIEWENLREISQVIVVDFSFPYSEMKRLAEEHELVWIDHHISALIEFSSISLDWSGIRSIDEAACVLTWQYFFPGKPVPKAVVLIGDRDIWRWAEIDTGAFNEGLYVQDTHAENDHLWKPLLEDDPLLLKQLLDEGTRLREIRLAETKKLLENRGFSVLFEGYKTLAINTQGNGDLGQYGCDLGYQIVYCYQDQMQNNQLMTVVTLFSRSIDVSTIAKRLNGGGHAGAAGFSFPRSGTPFPTTTKVSWSNVGKVI